MSALLGYEAIGNEKSKIEMESEGIYSELISSYQQEEEQSKLLDLQRQQQELLNPTAAENPEQPPTFSNQGPVTGYDSFRDNWMGKPTDYQGGGGKNPYGYQCVALVQQYAKDVWGIDGLQGGNAIDFATNYNPEQANYTANDPSNQKQRPPKGAVVVYGGTSDNPFGHIAIVDDPGSGNSFTSFDQNVCGSSGGWGGGEGKCVPRIVNHVFDGSDGFGSVVGWLTPKN
jgi:hypothetical protein